MIFFGVIYFLFGLVLLLVVYVLSREVLDIVGCQLGVLIDEWLWWVEGSFDFLVTIVDEDELKN